MLEALKAQLMVNGWVTDPAQQNAAHALSDLLAAIQNNSNTEGVYLWGPVGRGKTWLMDAFYARCPVPARRVHFHHFMRDLHQELHRCQGVADPLTFIAAQWATQVRVLCFDELFVSDIADAMLLGRLWTALFNQGITIVLTSNQAPDDLYQNGFNREQFLPAIAAIKTHMEIVAVDGGRDHRSHQRLEEKRYFICPNESAEFQAKYVHLTQGMKARSDDLRLGNVHIPCVSRHEAIAQVTFEQICCASISALDYAYLKSQCCVLFVSGIPLLHNDIIVSQIARGTEDGSTQVKAGDRVLPALSKCDDAARRFIALIDECYDQKILLVLEAHAPIDELYGNGFLQFSFQRTRSRVREMQRLSFGALSEN